MTQARRRGPAPRKLRRKSYKGEIRKLFKRKDAPVLASDTHKERD